MRLVAGRDYYDGASVHGIDRDVVFVRNHRDPIPAEKAPLLHRWPDFKLKEIGQRTRRARGWRFYLEDINPWKTWPSGVTCVSIPRDKAGRALTLWPVHAYVAGKRYGGVLAEVGRLIESSAPTEVTHLWTHAKLVELLAGLNLELAKEEGRSRWSREDPYHPSQHFSAEATDSEVEWLIDNKVTTATLTRHGKEPLPRGQEPAWDVDRDNLKAYGLYRILEPTQAFQDIMSWVSGVLPGTGRPMVEISDSDKAHKRGFDKWSFRRQGKASSP